MPMAFPIAFLNVTALVPQHILRLLRYEGAMATLDHAHSVGETYQARGGLKSVFYAMWCFWLGLGAWDTQTAAFLQATSELWRLRLSTFDQPSFHSFIIPGRIWWRWRHSVSSGFQYGVPICLFSFLFESVSQSVSQLVSLGFCARGLWILVFAQLVSRMDQATTLLSD